MATSLEILAPYLPYGIEVETGIDDGEHERKQLHGLTQDGYPRTRLHGLEEAASFSDMLPVLRPFSALCEPLEDGTVPAVEVAKLVMLVNRPESRTPIASYGEPILKQMGQVVSVDCHRDTSYTLELLIDATWAACTVYDFGVVYAHNMLAVHSYLRSKHFAVGLEPGQYIEKVSSAAPIDKNTALTPNS